MANYETLADGGHEHLIATVKPLVDQKANEHDIDVSVKELVENQPRGQLTGEILMTSHAYDMPPVSVTVEGKSTQVTTTGKNLLSDVADDWSLASLGGTSYRCTFVPVEDGASYIYHRETGSTSMSAGWADDTDGTGFVAIASMSDHNSGYTFTNSDSHRYLVFYFASSATADAAANAMSEGKVQVEAGTSYSGYEVYTGRAASPRPDWPQEIVSVKNPALSFAGKQLMDWAHPFRTGSYNYDIAVGSTIVQDSSANVNVSVDGSIMTVYIAAAWNGAIWRSPNLPNGTYRIYLPLASDGGGGTGTSHGSTLFVVDKNNKVVRKLATHATTGNWSHNITLSGDETAICVNAGTRSGTYGKTFIYDSPQLEVGNAATDYAPFSMQSVQLPVTLRSLPDGTKDTLALSYLRPSTREGWAWYSRTLVQRAYATRFGDITWALYTNKPNPYFRATLSLVKTKSSNDGQTNVMCTSYQKTSGTTLFNNTSIQSLYNIGTWELGSNSHYIAVVDKQYETAADFIAAMGDTIVQYPLATPITTTLDPIELPHMPLGDVTIWSDPTTGLTVNYIVEGKAIEASLETGIANALAAIATVETSPTTYNHAVGSRIVYDEVLYRVTSAIASGEDIVPGTNVEATTVTDEIKRLQQ